MNNVIDFFSGEGRHLSTNVALVVLIQAKTEENETVVQYQFVDHEYFFVFIPFEKYLSMTKFFTPIVQVNPCKKQVPLVFTDMESVKELIRIEAKKDLEYRLERMNCHNYYL